MIAYHILKSYILKAVLPSQSDKKPLLCQFISLHNNYYKFYFFQREIISYPSSVCRTEASKNVFIAWIM